MPVPGIKFVKTKLWFFFNLRLRTYAHAAVVIITPIIPFARDIEIHPYRVARVRRVSVAVIFFSTPVYYTYKHPTPVRI